MIKIIQRLLTIVFCLLLTACHDTRNQPIGNTIKIGTIAGPETQLMETVKQVAKTRYGLTIDIIPFTDYTLPNRALASGDIDANMFQHRPFLEADMQAHGYRLAIVGRTFLYPMAIYSDKIKHLKQLPNKATVAIPNDASNEARALLLLQQAGLIQLPPNASVTILPKAIVKNPKHLVFNQLDASTLPRALQDVTIAVINTNYAALAGLSPQKDGLFVEDHHSPYANLLVVRAADQQKPQFQELLEALHSPQVVAKAEQLFSGSAIPAWTVTHASLPLPHEIRITHQ